jgi:hypothetical protein
VSVLTLAQAKTHLNIPVTTYDTELQDFIDAAEAAIVRKCGPLVSTATTVKLMHPGGLMSLPTTPAISLTSITDSSGTAASLTGVSVSSEGIVFGATFPADLYTVVYQAGRATTPPDLLMAVKELLRHLWVSQRGAGVRPGSPINEPAGSLAYAFPFRVSELIADHVQVP